MLFENCLEVDDLSEFLPGLRNCWTVLCKFPVGLLPMLSLARTRSVQLQSDLPARFVVLSRGWRLLGG